MSRITTLIAGVWLVAGCAAAASPAGSPAASPAAPSTAAVPTPGATAEIRSVEVGGRSFYMECRGSGSPTVILESGMGGDHQTWSEVALEVSTARPVRVCTYNRANIEPTDAASGARTVADSVEDLDAVLNASSEGPPPYVLVGFSWGGMVTQLYAATHPADVAGLVLVESNHPDEVDDFWAELTPAAIEDDRAFMRDNPEGLDLEASFEEVKAAQDLPEVPLVVVTSGLSEGWPEEWGDPAVFDAIRAGHQKDLAARIPGGVQIIAEQSKHHVPSEQPEVIVDAIVQVLDRLP